MTRIVYTSSPHTGAYQRTAEDIYHHLVNHPEQQPSDDDNNRPAHLVVRLDEDETVIQFSDLTQGTITAFPGVATAAYEVKGWSAFTGDPIGNGVILHEESLAPGAEGTQEHREAIRRIRLVVMRAIRYRDKKAARRVA